MVRCEQGSNKRGRKKKLPIPEKNLQGALFFQRGEKMMWGEKGALGVTTSILKNLELLIFYRKGIPSCYRKTFFRTKGGKRGTVLGKKDNVTV